mmetsp:Transcript_14933/g.24323  ORF Transcript_14933/g.24323 Transcript_14933/m.24323 type:complete len:224 (-) Transcript_14933:2344-3015(-)
MLIGLMGALLLSGRCLLSYGVGLWQAWWRDVVSSFSDKGGGLLLEKGDAMSKVIVVGLGNFGSPKMRHSVGASALKAIGRDRGVSMKNMRKWNALAAVDGDVVMVEPKTLLNVSGPSVGKCLRDLGLGPDRLVVIHDDMDVKLGKVKVKQGGSARGHKGVLSVIESLGTTEFKRVCVGIGRPPKGRSDVVGFLLGNFSSEESRQVHQNIMPKVVEEVNKIVNS